jgi:hypothetical protein
VGAGAGVKGRAAVPAEADEGVLPVEAVAGIAGDKRAAFACPVEKADLDVRCLVKR